MAFPIHGVNGITDRLKNNKGLFQCRELLHSRETLERLESSKDEFQLFKFYCLVEKEKLLETMIHASMSHRIP